ncbi:V-type H+-transporting ATPase subunit e [Malassezia restricta]|uniref:V-type H+-transporting ATPase subunit e n=1 Tax=Malassezia restricta TaxID=76775 RepID=UPI000DD18890|nr:V-type H+-transporting ATPase subunit e [Malassezia restricta]AXA48240.1 V-type H+-transporting ATPase subunit e [Malassezia restricta]
MSGWTTIWVLFVAVCIGAIVWNTAPKGPNQELIRWSVALGLACCYMMWACVYLAQLHPLIQPKRSDVRFFD